MGFLRKRGAGGSPAEPWLRHPRASKLQRSGLAASLSTSGSSLPSTFNVGRSMFDAPPPSLTVASLGKAAAALGRKVELRFVPA
jgi:hypothetical protein